VDDRTLVYKGWLTLGSNGEEDDILFLCDKPISDTWDDEPLAELLKDVLEERIVSVNYYISNEEVTIEQAQERFLGKLYGISYADYYMHYSEVTGYLWTDEELQIGGHDLLEELKSHKGEYLILQATVHTCPKCGYDRFQENWGSMFSPLSKPEHICRKCRGMFEGAEVSR
jgi:hypothetical protein